MAEGIPEAQQETHDLCFLVTLQDPDHGQDQLVCLADELVHGDTGTGCEGIVHGADERPDLVQHCSRLIEQVTEDSSILVSPGEAEYVVKPLGDFTIIDVPGEIL